MITPELSGVSLAREMNVTVATSLNQHPQTAAEGSFGPPQFRQQRHCRRVLNKGSRKLCILGSIQRRPPLFVLGAHRGAVFHQKLNDVVRSVGGSLVQSRSF